MWSSRANYASAVSPNISVTLQADSAIWFPVARRTPGKNGGNAKAVPSSRELERSKTSCRKAGLSGAIDAGLRGPLCSPLEMTPNGKLDLQRLGNSRTYPSIGNE